MTRTLSPARVASSSSPTASVRYIAVLVGRSPETWLQVSGPQGQVYLDAWENSSYVMTGAVQGGGVERRNLIPRPFQVQRIVGAYQELIGLVERGGEGVSSGREARKTLQIILGFLKSHQEGGKVVPVPEMD